MQFFLMKNVLLFLCFLSILLSCKKKENLQFETHYFEARSTVDCSTDNCAYAHFEIPVASGINEGAVKKINTVLQDFVKSKLTNIPHKNTSSYDTLALNFIKAYDEDRKASLDDAVAWEVNFKLNHNSLSSETYQIVWNYFFFTGEAQAKVGVKTYFFNTQTGIQIPLKDLFLNFEGFKKYAEKEFNKQFISKQNLERPIFTDTAFKLPENVYEQNNEWILHYNAEEFSVNALDEIIIKLPKEKLTPFLNPLHFKN